MEVVRVERGLAGVVDEKGARPYFSCAHSVWRKTSATDKTVTKTIEKKYMDIKQQKRRQKRKVDMCICVCSMYMCVCVCVCVCVLCVCVCARARVSACVCVYLLLSDFFLLGQRDESLVFICILCSAKKKMRIILCSEKIFLSVGPSGEMYARARA